MDTMRKKSVRKLINKKKHLGCNCMFKLSKFYKNKTVVVTGATGFSCWMCSWLLKLGAKFMV